MKRLPPLKFKPSLRTKIWGTTDLSPVYGTQPNKIGEAWYTHEQNTVAGGPLAGRSLGSLLEEYGARMMGASYKPYGLKRTSADPSTGGASSGETPYFPILTKLLFTSERLSVQVHPSDDYALEHEGGPGKTEMWYVVAARPGAQLALGLTQDLDRETLAATARSGEIERYLRWVGVEAGQTVFVSPGTLHTLGPGVVICEIQQNSDLTYRFYDFGRLGDDGRPRALHIDQGARVTNVRSRPSPTAAQTVSNDGYRLDRLAECSYFAAERMSAEQPFDYEPDPGRAHILVVVQGAGTLSGIEFETGDAFLIPAEADAFKVEPTTPVQLIRAFVPS